MNVLFVSSFSSDYRSSYTHRILQLKSGLEKMGIHTDILYLGDYPFNSPSLLQPLNIPILFSQIIDYEVIHCGGTVSSYVMGVVKPFIRSKLVYDVHGCHTDECRLMRKSIFDLVGNHLLLQAIIMESIATKHSDYFVTCSEKLKQYYINKGLKKDRIKVIRNGVDIELFKPKYNQENESFTVTYAGAFQKWQGIENLINAAKSLKANDIKFKIIGFTKNDYSLKMSIKRILNDKVVLVDKVSQPELVNHLNSSNVLIIPRSRHVSTQVAFPTKFAEYIAIGKPVIVTRVSEISTLVEKYNCGFVCEPTAHSLAKTILKTSEMLPERLVEKGMNGRRLAENVFDQRVIDKEYLNFLSSIK